MTQHPTSKVKHPAFSNQYSTSPGFIQSRFLLAGSGSVDYSCRRKLSVKTKAQFPEEQSEDGEFERQEDAFRDLVSAGGSSPYPATAGRYHLYVSLACPWASRTL